MTRGFRGATTVEENTANEILQATKELMMEMIAQNRIQPEQVSHVFFSVSPELNAAFPAKAARELPGWGHVPVMCMQEINVPNSLPNCIRIMLVATTELEQDQIQHVFLKKAIQLRPDLTKGEGE